MLKSMIKKITEGQDLTQKEMTICMGQMMSGLASESQIAGFITALKIKGESIDEIVAGVKVLRNKAKKVNLKNYYTIDTCGTGGDKSGTYNISTAVAFVAAAADVKVVKHGNRSVSSKCGSADVLEQLGVNLNLTETQVETCVKETNIGFLFAQNFHHTMRYVAKTRKELGFRTIFNILGPLVNPANANAQVLGVYDEKLVEPMARVLLNLGVKRALVVHGKDGLDEISITSETIVSEIIDGKIKNYIITPEQFGFKRGDMKDIIGGSVQQNAEIIRNLFNGEKGKGTKRDILLLNAGAALYIGEKVHSISEGIKLAQYLIDNNRVNEKLNEFIVFTQNITNNQTSSILTEIVETKKIKLQQLKSDKSTFFNAINKQGLSIIGEVKKASPSKGLIKENFDPVNIAKEYEHIVDAVSVLTEEDYFQGNIEYLKNINESINLPLLRKDFIIDPIQIYEAKACGANCILLITNILEPSKLKEFISIANTIGLDTLVETHNAYEIEIAQKAGADIIGINNRNLNNFEVNVNTTVKLRKEISDDILVISESGFHTKEDIAKLKETKIDAILVGESFMKSTNMSNLAKEFKNAYNS